MVTFTNAFIQTNKSKQIKNSFDYLEKAGLIFQQGAGSFAMMPLGQKVLDNISAIVDAEMASSGALKVSLPMIQSAEIWKQSGRWDVYGREMLKCVNSDGKEFCVGPTHEEQMTSLVKQVVNSPKDLPVILYQSGMKYRDELRPRHGLLRTREFIMMDAYSFDKDKKGLDASYAVMRKAFSNIFDSIGLKIHYSEAATGEVGGKFSEEFLAPASFGEDKIMVDGEESSAIEPGHIFKLGNKYSTAFNLNVRDENNVAQPVEMGCYGIGISRLLPTIVDQHHDEKGIIWPQSITPYTASIVPINIKNNEQANAAYGLHDVLEQNGVQTVLDDRKASAGVKFSDADILGFPYQIIVGRSINDGNVEIKNRATNKSEIVPVSNVAAYLK